MKIFRYLENIVDDESQSFRLTRRSSGGGSSKGSTKKTTPKNSGAKKKAVKKTTAAKKPAKKTATKTASKKTASKTTSKASKKKAPTKTTSIRSARKKLPARSKASAKKVGKRTTTKTTKNTARKAPAKSASSVRPPSGIRTSQESRKNDQSSRWESFEKNAGKTRKLTLVHAADDTSFWVSSGPVLKNLMELHDALERISDEQYGYHARQPQDNDFVRWVGDVLCDGDCARALENAQSRHHARDMIRLRLQSYDI